MARKISVYPFLILLGFWLISPQPGRAQQGSASVLDTLAYTYYFPFIHYQDNFVEWTEPTALARFFQALDSAKQKQVRVVHIGDSHVQADWITGYVRNKYQQRFGHGGRGMVFPYACANTHSAYDYNSYSYGNWAYAKNVQEDPAYDLGLSGATVATADEKAWFKFVFTDDALKPSFTQLDLYLERRTSSFDLVVQLGERDTFHVDVWPDSLVDSTQIEDSLHVRLQLPEVSDTLSIYVKKQRPEQKRLEFYGLSLSNPGDSGVLYHSVGINGAGYTDVMRQNLMYDQLKQIQPQLVIIDFGANDFDYRYYKKDALKANLSSIIDAVRKALPGVSILVTNVQDAYRRWHNLIECSWFAVHTREVAMAKGCAYYDYYHVAGGRYSMLQWRSYGLAKSDKVHLKPGGYYLKGDLYYQAMMGSYALYKAKDQLKSLRAQNPAYDSLFKYSFEYKAEEVESNVRKQGNKITYTIRPGDNLGFISQRFGVRVSQIQQWNNMSGTRIYPGKVLVLYADPKKRVQNPNPKLERSTLKKADGTLLYTVRGGDNLTSIASKFGVRVEQLKAWNKLASDRINMGQQLMIHPNEDSPAKEKKSKKPPETGNQDQGYYTVRRGDSLWIISQKLDIPVQQLKAWNKLSNDALQPGQKLRIKP